MNEDELRELLEQLGITGVEGGTIRVDPDTGKVQIEHLLEPNKDTGIVIDPETGKVRKEHWLGPDEDTGIVIDPKTGRVRKEHWLGPDEDTGIAIDTKTGKVRKEHWLGPDEDTGIIIDPDTGRVQKEHWLGPNENVRLRPSSTGPASDRVAHSYDGRVSSGRTSWSLLAVLTFRVLRNCITLVSAAAIFVVSVGATMPGVPPTTLFDAGVFVSFAMYLWVLEYLLLRRGEPRPFLLLFAGIAALPVAGAAIVAGSPQTAARPSELRAIRRPSPDVRAPAALPEKKVDNLSSEKNSVFLFRLAFDDEGIPSLVSAQEPYRIVAGEYRPADDPIHDESGRRWYWSQGAPVAVGSPVKAHYVEVVGENGDLDLLGSVPIDFQWTRRLGPAYFRVPYSAKARSINFFHSDGHLLFTVDIRGIRPSANMESCYNGIWHENQPNEFRWEIAVSENELRVRRTDDFVSGTFLPSGPGWNGTLNWGNGETWTGVVLHSANEACNEIHTNQRWWFKR